MKAPAQALATLKMENMSSEDTVMILNYYNEKKSYKSS